MKKEKQAALMTQQLQLAAVEESAPEACDPVEVATDVDAVPTPIGGSVQRDAHRSDSAILKYV